MKTLTRILAFVIALAGAAVSHAGSFGGEKALSNVSIGSQFPEVAYYNNTIHVVWVGYGPGLQGDIFYTRSTDHGSTFSTPVNLSASATGSTGNDRPQVTAGPNGVFVAWNTDNNTGVIELRRSTDGGLNFAAKVQIADSGPSTYSRITDLFTDSLGRVHVSYYDNGFTNPLGIAGMIMHRMTSDGSTWGPAEQVTSQTIDGDVDNEESRLAEVGGQLYIVYKNTLKGDPQGGWSPYSVYMKKGTVTGCPGACTTAWSYPGRRLGGGLPFSFASLYRPEIASDSSGALHLAYWDQQKGANVFYRRGTPAAGSGTFSAPVNMSNFGVDHLQPGGISSNAATTLGGYQAPPALASNGTTAFMAYQKHTTITAGTIENGPIYLRESADNGVTWGPEQSISTTGTGTTPRIAVGGASNQNVAIVWTDARTGGAVIYFRIYTLGGGSGPSFDLTPGLVNFGNQPVGSATTSTTLTLVNTGLAGNISAITVSGDYARTGGTCAVGPIAGGANCTIQVRFLPTALGTRNGTVSIATDAFGSPHTATLTGTGVASASFSANVNAVVTGYYETILNRSPDAGGLTFWSSEANRVVALGADVREVFFAMSMQFFFSAEYLARNTTDTQFLTDMYRTFFIREPDGPGLAFWQNELNIGVSRSALLNSFLFSTEFSNQMTSLFGTVSVRPEVNMTIDLFRGALGRLPDDGGFNFWLGRIRTAQCDGAAAVSTEVNSLAALFFTSAEYAARARSTPDFVGDLYNAFLRRGPGGDSGYHFWVSQINTAALTRDQVRASFVPSAEFQARVSAVIAAGCLP